MRAFGAGCEFGGVLGVVLSALDANLASPVAGFAAIHAESANIVFFSASSDVRADHETVASVAKVSK